MANTDARFGLRPWGNVLRVQRYAIVTEYATAVFVCDPMGMTGTSYTTKFGQGVPGVEVDVDGAAGAIVGSVVGVESYEGEPLQYLPASTVGDGTIAGFALVADHPDQLFVIQEDGVATPVAAASIGLNADMIATHAGDTGTGVSGVELNSDTVATTVTLALHVLRAHPDDTIGSANCRFIVTINAHYHGSNVVGL